MATVVLNPDVVTEAAIAATYTGGLSLANTYKFRNNGKTILHFKKTGAGICAVTVATAQVVRGHAVANVPFNVPAAVGDVFVGPFSPDLYNDANNDVSFTLSEITGLTVAVVQQP
jgi:hypothetical protein